MMEEYTTEEFLQWVEDTYWKEVREFCEEIIKEKPKMESDRAYILETAVQRTAEVERLPSDFTMGEE